MFQPPNRADTDSVPPGQPTERATARQAYRWPQGVANNSYRPVPMPAGCSRGGPFGGRLPECAALGVAGAGHVMDRRLAARPDMGVRFPAPGFGQCHRRAIMSEHENDKRIE